VPGGALLHRRFLSVLEGSVELAGEDDWGNSAQRTAPFLPQKRPHANVFPGPLAKSPRHRTSLTPP
jgi:hypothetical protein